MRVAVDLIGDGLGPVVSVTGEGLEVFSQLRFPIVKAGRYSVHLIVTDVCGREGRTGVERIVEGR